MKARDKAFLRKKPHTIEWLIDKWTKRIWKAYALYSDKGDCVLPSFLRKEFEIDIRAVFEQLYKEVSEGTSLWKPPCTQDIQTELKKKHVMSTLFQKTKQGEHS